MRITCFHCGRIIKYEHPWIISRNFYAREEYLPETKGFEVDNGINERCFEIHLCQSCGNKEPVKRFYIQALHEKVMNYMMHLTTPIAHLGGDT